MVDIVAARAIFLTPMPVDSISKEDLALKDEDPNLSAIMRGFDLDTSRIDVRSGFEEQVSLDGNEQEYLGRVDFDEAFGIAGLDRSEHLPGEKV
jgi:hypothetical protein